MTSVLEFPEKTLNESKTNNRKIMVEEKNEKLIINIIIRNEIEKIELHILSIIIE